MDEVAQLSQLASQQQWLLFFGVLSMFLVELQKRPGFDFLWRRLPDGYQWVAAFVTAGLLGFGKGVADGRTLPVALIQAGVTALVSGPIASGTDAMLTNSKLPWGGPGGRKK